MKHEKKKKRGYVKRHSLLRHFWIAVGILFALSLTVGLAWGGYVYSQIDFSLDEQLFALASGSRTTRLYYSEARTGGGLVKRLEGYSLTGQAGDIPLELLPRGYHPVEMENIRIFSEADSVWCPYGEIPRDLKNAFLAIEDRRFFEHEGVDWLRTAKAAVNYLLQFDDRFGASTVTQQLIKNISSDDEISIERKLREIFRAIHLEQNHSKEEIFELYLNIVPLSEGCVGVAAAAEIYFGKTPKELTLGECATIAAITNLPTYYNPAENPENNRTRRDLILSEMYAQEMIDEAAYREALAAPVVASGRRESERAPLDWYTETVLADVARDLSLQYDLDEEMARQMIWRGGLRIFTYRQDEVQKTLEAYFQNEKNFPAGLSCAMTVTDPQTGVLLGVVGGVGQKAGNRLLNYATAVTRAPGSALKPLAVYAPALEEGIITWGSVFDDVPISFSKSGTRTVAWPHNSPAVYQGLTDVYHAVVQSKNTVAVRVLEALGAERSYHYLTRRLHLDTLVRRREGASGVLTDIAAAPLALGQLTDGVSVRALTAGYGTLASGGVYHAPQSYALVLDGNGRVLLRSEERGERVFSPETASLMTRMLTGVVETGTARSISLKETQSTAGKTGTSGDNRDKWFVGYTPYLVAGIWCGYADGERQIEGAYQSTHLDTWDEVMKRLHRLPSVAGSGEARDFSAAGERAVYYCRDSGKLATEACYADPRGNRILRGYFVHGTEPSEACDCHVLVSYRDGEGGGVCLEGEGDRRVGLIKVTTRAFPVQVYVGDAQYVYRAYEGDFSPSEGGQAPYFAPSIEAGVYVGISPTADGRQFNTAATPSTDYEDLPFDAGDDGSGPFEGTGDEGWLLRRFSSFFPKRKRGKSP